MEQDDPRRDLDDFSAAICEKLRDTCRIIAQTLLSLDKDMALAQIDILHKRTIDRLKGSAFDLDMWMIEIGADKSSDEEAAKVTRVVIAAMEQTFNDLREHVVDVHTDDYRGDPDDPE